MDRQDVLAGFRSRFVIGDPELIYLDGNSLGRLPKETAVHMHHVIKKEWGHDLIRSWNRGWIDAAGRIGGKIAALIGAQPDEVIVADSTSVNLFKLAVAALQIQDGRHKILTDDLNFPSDIYILQNVRRLLGKKHQVEIVSSADGIYGPVAGLETAVDHQTALLTLSHTAFKSGFTYDMVAVTEKAQQAGALVLWDLSHSAGVVPIDLNACNVDLAVGCTYKYLNGGPGAPAFLYIRRDLQKKLHNPIAGWMGHNSMFAFDLEYEPAPGLRRFLSGTPPILALSAIEPGLDLLREAGIQNVRAKSVQLSEFLMRLWESDLEPLGFRLRSPLDWRQRGSHISLGHDEGHRIDLALIHEMQTLPDFRAPDNIRLGLAPLYTSFMDVATAVNRIRQVVLEKRFEKYAYQENVVT